MKKRLVFVGFGMSAAAVIVSGVVYGISRPTEHDYRAVRDSVLPAVKKDITALKPAVNRYIEEFGQAQGATKSVDEAAKQVDKSMEALQAAESAVTASLKDLKNNRVANVSRSSIAIDQFVTDTEAYDAYLLSLARSYKDFRSLFGGDDNTVCGDIFMTQNLSLAERRDRLATAVEDCYAVLERLEKSGNGSYVEFAVKLKRRIAQLETFSVQAAKGEQAYKQYETERADAEKRLTNLATRSAPNEEYKKLLDQITDLGSRISDSRADFDTATAAYARTVKELPPLVESVFADSVPNRLKSLESLVDVREKTLQVIVDDEIARF